MDTAVKRRIVFTEFGSSLANVRLITPVGSACNSFVTTIWNIGVIWVDGTGASIEVFDKVENEYWSVSTVSIRASTVCLGVDGNEI